jgi:hypothetical protein
MFTRYDAYKTQTLDSKIQRKYEFKVFMTNVSKSQSLRVLCMRVETVVHSLNEIFYL